MMVVLMVCTLSGERPQPLPPLDLVWLKCQSLGHLMRRADTLEKTLMLEEIESRKRRG